MIAKDEKDLILRLEKIYPNKNTYNKVIYVDDSIPICIDCKKHGEFFLSPYSLIVERKGCPKCYSYQSNGEKRVKEILEEYGIKFEQEKNMPQLWYRGPLYFDFFIPEYNFAIEFQGPQHFKPIEFFGGRQAFEEQKQRDDFKRKWCKENNVELIEVNFYEEVLPQLKPLLDIAFYDKYE